MRYIVVHRHWQSLRIRADTPRSAASRTSLETRWNSVPIAHLDPDAREQLRADLAKAEGLALQLAQAYGDALAILSEPVHVDLGLAEQGADVQQSFPPCGTELLTELVTADELILGDRAVPADRQVVGPAKDAFAHFHRIDGTSAPHGGQRVLGWDSEDRVVACDWPFVRITSGRVVVSSEDGAEAHYTWEVGR